MQDRVPTYPGRVQLMPVPGQANKYDMVRADEPTQVGDALNKANLLPDAVATALGLTGNPQVKDALAKIKTLIDGNTTLANSKAKIETGSYAGTGAFGASNPNSLTFDFAPKIVWIFAFLVTSYNGYFATAMTTTSAPLANMARLTTSYTVYGAPFNSAGESAYSKKSADGKTITWYNNNADGQFNNSGRVYYYLAIG